MADQAPGAARPLAPFLKIGTDDRPYLEGIRCAACGEVLAVETRRACPRCAALGQLEPIRLAERGKLYAYTIVHRSFPGVAVPFVAAVVDLDGGGAIKGNLVGVEPADIRFDMPVCVAFEQLKSPEGEGPRVRHVFTPMAG